MTKSYNEGIQGCVGFAGVGALGTFFAFIFSFFLRVIRLLLRVRVWRSPRVMGP